MRYICPTTCDTCSNYHTLLNSSESLLKISEKYSDVSDTAFWLQFELPTELQKDAKVRIKNTCSKCYYDTVLSWKRFIDEDFLELYAAYNYCYGNTILHYEDESLIDSNSEVFFDSYENNSDNNIFKLMSPADLESYNAGTFEVPLRFNKGEPFSAVFGEFIKKSKKTLGNISLESNIDKGTLSRIFNDQQIPNKSHLYLLCLVLQMDVYAAIDAFHRCKGVEPISECSIPDIALLYFLEHKHYSIDDYIDDCWDAFEAFRIKPPRYFPYSLR